MSIEKFVYATLNQSEKPPYTIICNETINRIKNVDALAIFVYLSTKPHNWSIYLQEVGAHFGMGRDKTRNAFNYLKEIGLLLVKQHRDEEGKFVQNEFILKHFIDKNQETDPFTENPAPEKPALLNKEDNKVNIKNISLEKKIRKTYLPDDFQPTFENTEEALKKGITDEEFKTLLQKFKNWYYKKTKYAHWDKILNIWILDFKKDTSKGNAYNGRKEKSRPCDNRDREILSIFEDMQDINYTRKDNIC